MFVENKSDLLKELKDTQTLVQADLQSFEQKSVRCKSCLSVMQNLMDNLDTQTELSDMSEELKEKMNGELQILEQNLQKLDTQDGDEIARLNVLVQQRSEQHAFHESQTTGLVVQISELEIEIKRKDAMLQELRNESNERLRGSETVKKTLYQQNQQLELLLKKSVAKNNEDNVKNSERQDKLLKQVAAEQFKKDREKFQAELKPLQEELKRLKEFEKTSKEQTDRLLSKVAAEQFKKDKQKFQQEMQPLQEEVKQLREQYKTNKEKIKTQFQSLRQMRMEVEQAKRESAHLNEEKVELLKTKRELESSFSMEKAKVEEQASEIGQLKEQNTYLHESSISHEMKRQEAEVEQSKLKEENRAYTSELETLNADSIKNKKEKKVLIREIQKLRTDSQQKSLLLEDSKKELQQQKEKQKAKIKEVKKRQADVKSRYEDQLQQIEKRIQDVYSSIEGLNQTLESTSLEKLVHNSPNLTHVERLNQVNGFIEGMIPTIEGLLEQEDKNDEMAVGAILRTESLRGLCLTLLKDKAISLKRVNSLRSVGIYSVHFTDLPLGFTPVPSDDDKNLVVDTVKENSYADYKGVLVGSVICSINGTKTENKGAMQGTQIFSKNMSQMPLIIDFRPT